jgi:AcrR family transcriptional regulator
MTPSAGKGETRSAAPSGNARYGERLDDITRVAVRLFAERGYEATTIGDLATAVGLLKGSLYYYVPSKENLLFQILAGVQRSGSDILVEVEKLEREGADLETQIRTFVELGCQYTLTHPGEIAVYFRSFNSLSDSHRRALVDERLTYERALLRLIRKGQRTGTFDADVNPTVIMTAVYAMVNWLALSPAPERVSEERASEEMAVNDLAAAYADLLMTGVIKKAASSAG